MLFIPNQDKPGFIGHFGMTLANAGVNVATFHLGRTAPGENAIALVSVDQQISDHCCIRSARCQASSERRH